MYYSEVHRRRSIRLRGYDYTRPGACFVTICAHQQLCLFGEVVGTEMRPNALGQVVVEEWTRCATLRPNVRLDAFVVMPNHLHGILVLTDVRRGTARRAPTHEQFGKPVSGSLPTVIRAFKSAVAKRINEWRGTPGAPVWQRGYYEHVIRSEGALRRIREYILANPLRWASDQENPAAASHVPARRR